MRLEFEFQKFTIDNITFPRGLDKKFTIDEIEDIKVSISEACTNVIQHAYEEDPSASNSIIDIQINIINNELEIIVSDYGKGFDLAILGTREQKEKSKEKLGLGLGLTFIESLMDTTSFQSTLGKGTVIQMKKQSPNLATSSST